MTHPIPFPRLPAFDAFAGSAGFTEGLKGTHHTVGFAEIDPAANAVLAHRHPGVPNLGDVRTIDRLPGKVDLVTAGFPCTNLSQAGDKAGLYGDHSVLGLKVVEWMRARRAPVVVLENVTNMLSLGKGRAMADLLGRFEEIGYRWAYRRVCATAWGLPQRRHRLVFVLSLDAAVDPRQVLFADDAGAPPRATWDGWQDRATSFSWTEGKAGAGWGHGITGPLRVGSGVGIPSPPAIALKSGRVVTPGIEDAERLQGFRPGWTRAADDVERGARWRLVGRAIPTPIAGWVGANLRAMRTDAEITRRTPIADGKSWPSAGWGGFGDGRWRHRCSMYPVREDVPDVGEWIDHGAARDLSARAAAGFLRRLRSGNLRRPEAFEDVLEAHIATMRAGGYSTAESAVA